jgi:hypothetical protein
MIASGRRYPQRCGEVDAEIRSRFPSAQTRSWVKRFELGGLVIWKKHVGSGAMQLGCVLQVGVVGR